MLITITATLAYLGLAIFGRGGFAALFSHPALIALAIILLVLSGIAVFSGGNLSPGVREDRANRWVIAAFGFIGLLDAYLPAYTDRKEFWTLAQRLARSAARHRCEENDAKAANGIPIGRVTTEGVPSATAICREMHNNGCA